MAKKRKSFMGARFGTAFWWIGVWANAWWVVSGLWVVLLFWVSKSVYIEYFAAGVTDDYVGGFGKALEGAFTTYEFLPAFLWFILYIWALGGLVWLRELKKQRISYTAALKELFFTIK